MSTVYVVEVHHPRRIPLIALEGIHSSLEGAEANRHRMQEIWKYINPRRPPVVTVRPMTLND